MRYSEEIIEKVREANDIVSVIGQYVKLEKKGANYFGLCPFHNEKSPSFSVSPHNQIYYCFGCNKGGNVISFLMEYENISFPEALRVLADRAGISLPEEKTFEDPQEKRQRTVMLSIYKDTAFYFHDCLYSQDGIPGLKYLSEKRKLTRQTITHFGLGFSSPASDGLYKYLKHVKKYSDDELKSSGLITFSEKGPRCLFWNRVMFPIMDVNNHVIGFGGRVMGDGEPKYLNSKESLIFNKSSVLYGLNFAKKTREKFLLLCEGYMDVISLHQAGFTNAVASLGTAFTESHARLLRRYTDTVILTQDSDEAGIRARMRSFPILHAAGLHVKVLDMGPYKDPDEFIKANGPDAYRTCINNAKNAFLYNMQMLRRQYDFSDPAKVTEFYRTIADELTVFSDTLERDNYIQAVSREQSVDYASLKELTELAVLKQSGGKKTSVEMRPIPLTGQNEAFQKSVNDRIKGSEDLLLYWISERKDIRDLISSYLHPEDFSTPVKQKLARIILAEDPGFSVSSFLSTECTEEERSEVGKIFVSTPYIEEEAGDQGLSKLLTEALRNILLTRNEDKLRNGQLEKSEYQRLLLEKIRIKKINLPVI